MTATPKSQKILQELSKQYEAITLIHRLFKENPETCICEDLKEIRSKTPRLYTKVLTPTATVTSCWQKTHFIKTIPHRQISTPK